MVVANCSEDDRTVSIRKLTQWDYGQVLKVCGIPVRSDTIQVHFALEGSDSALIVLARVEDGNILAEIPNSMLKNGRDINAYIYVANESEGRTIYKITLYVKKRPRPEEYDAPADKNVLQQIIESVSKKADGIKIDGKKVQLLSGEKEIGTAAELPETAGTIEAITTEEIDSLFN